MLSLSTKTIDITDDSQLKYQNEYGTNKIDYANLGAVHGKNHLSSHHSSLSEEPFRGEQSAALKASPGVQQLQRLVECIQLSELQVKHIDFHNRLHKKKQKMSSLMIKCRNITQEQLL